MLLIKIKLQNRMKKNENPSRLTNLVPHVALFTVVFLFTCFSAGTSSLKMAENMGF